MDYMNITITDLINDAKAKGTEATGYLKELVNTRKANRYGEDRPLSFIAIKRAYMNRYYPESIPQAKAKAPTMKELIMSM